MNWKIILIIIIAKIEAISSCRLNGSSDRKNWQHEQHLEKLYDEEFLKSLDSVPPKMCSLDNNDIKFLSSECGTDIKCLDEKKVSENNYQLKFVRIETTNGIFLKRVHADIEKLMNDGETTLLESLVKQYSLYVGRMLSMFYAAKWKPHKWQVHMFIILNSKDPAELATLKSLVESPLKTADKLSETILPTIRGLYDNDEFEQAYKNAHSITVSKLMLFHLYGKHDVIIHNSKLGIDLYWERVDSAFVQIINSNRALFNSDNWSRLRSEFYRYHSLFLKCILVRLLFFTWYHVNMSITMLSTYKKNKNIFKRLVFKRSVLSKQELCQHWSSLVDPLKRIMRFFLINDGVFWIALRNMMDDITIIGQQEIQNLEEMLKNTFLSIVRTMNLGDKESVGQQLKKLTAVKDLKDNIVKTKSNSDYLNSYTNHLQQALTPLDAWFLSWLSDAIESLDLMATGNTHQ